MPDLTLKRLDAVILKTLKIKAGSLTATELGQTMIRCQFSDIRKVALAVMQAAVRIECPMPYAFGTNEHSMAIQGKISMKNKIRATALRLKREVKANG